MTKLAKGPNPAMQARLSHLWCSARQSARRIATAAALIATALLLPSAEAATGAKNFDHMSTGFPLTGQHEIARCEDCHVRGIFKGTPTQCASCHVQGGFVTAKFFSADHFPTTTKNGIPIDEGAIGNMALARSGISEPCSTCHTTASFYGAHFAHSALASGYCDVCHKTPQKYQGVLGKTANHLQTTSSCDVCHTTASFQTAYLAYPTGHIPTSQPCATCHASNAFVPGVMNHTGTAGTCTLCHAPGATPYKFTIAANMAVGGKAVVVIPMSQGGLNATKTTGAVNHIPVTASCDACHTNGVFTIGSAFKGGGMRHAAVAGASCSSCHNVATVFAGTGPGTGGQPFQIPGAVGTPGAANHIPVNGIDCASSGCHAVSDAQTTTGTGFATNITPALSAAGHASVNLACQTCHTVGMTWKGVTTMVTPAATHIPPDNLNTGTVACASCHSATSFGTGGFKITSSPLMSVAAHTAVASAVPLCTTCH